MNCPTCGCSIHSVTAEAADREAAGVGTRHPSGNAEPRAGAPQGVLASAAAAPLGHGFSPRPEWAGTCPRCGAAAGKDCLVLTAADPAVEDRAPQQPEALALLRALLTATGFPVIRYRPGDDGIARGVVVLADLDDLLATADDARAYLARLAAQKEPEGIGIQAFRPDIIEIEPGAWRFVRYEPCPLGRNRRRCTSEHHHWGRGDHVVPVNPNWTLEQS